MIAVRESVPRFIPWILGAAVASGALAAAPDPHEIYQVAIEQLGSGNLNEAEASASRLRDLITRRPEWDPDGVFARELLPSMQARLLRLRLATRELDEFTERSLKGAEPPEIGEDQDAVRDYGDWATSTIDRLRRERDDLIAAGLPAAEDQAVLARTKSYARSQQLLETDILRRMAEAVNSEVEILMPQDRRWHTIHARLEKIKKAMMESVVERDRLRRELESLQAGTRAYQAALLGLVLDGAGPTSTAETAPAGGLGSFFSDHLDREIEKLRSEPAQSRLEYLTRLKSIERYRRGNRVLARAGLIEDQTARITLLARVVEKTPYRGRAWALVAAPRWITRSLIGLLAAVAVALCWVAARRRRSLVAARARLGNSVSGRVTSFPQGKDGTNAA